MSSSRFPVRKIASNLLWTPQGWVTHPLVTLDAAGRLLAAERCDAPDRQAGVEFHAGVLVPGCVVRDDCRASLRASEGMLLERWLERRGAREAMSGFRLPLAVGEGAWERAAESTSEEAAERAVPACGQGASEDAAESTSEGASERAAEDAVPAGEDAAWGELALVSGLDYERMEITPRTRVQGL